MYAIQLLYLIPNVFLALWLEFANCPRGIVWLEAIILFTPVIIPAFYFGITNRKTAFRKWNCINFLISIAGTACFALSKLECNTCGILWINYFKPFSAFTATVVFYTLALFIQLLFFCLGAIMFDSNK